MQHGTFDGSHDDGRRMGRRAMIQSTAAAALGLLATGGLKVPTARAAGLWNPGPKSGLPFWIGGFGNLPELAGLMPPTRQLDLVHLFESPGHYAETVRAVNAWFPFSKEAALLASGAAAGLQWTSSPFCYGGADAPPAAWPSGPSAITTTTWLNASRPPTFTGSETAAERAAKQRRVWRMAADGWLDPIWRWKFVEIKRGFFVKKNLRSIRIVLRVAHELNLNGRDGRGWGSKVQHRAHNIGQLTGLDDAAMVKEALRRYIALFLEVFGKIQPEIAGDFAYRADQLWPYWCPIPEQYNPFDVCLTCPDNAKLAGPDVYDNWPTGLSDAEFAVNSRAYSRQGWPKGIQTWADWATATGRLLAVGEFGLMTTEATAEGTRPYHQGWDNPAFIRGMLNLFRDYADRVAFLCYFNRDLASSPDLAGHLIAPWSGIEDPAIACARTPVGDVNRCGARAWRAWMAAAP